jgi:predicted glycoside hydrolase/deacetylase ChbG (UPF0249 family)
MTQSQYNRVWDNAAATRDYLDSVLAEHPEIFPASMIQGYQFHGRLPESKKLPGIRLRQIRTGDGVFTLRPSFVLSFMTGTTDNLERLFPDSGLI